MQDLTRDTRTGAKALLVPSSMSAGNTVADDPGLAMTAPGSAGIMPLPDRMDNLPLPENTGAQIPVSHPGQHDKVEVQGSGHGSGQWTDAHDIPGPSRWKEADGSG